MNKSAYLLVFLVLGFYSSAASSAEELDSVRFADIGECKAFYEQVKEEDISKLREKKKLLGPGMPSSIYGRKMKKITAEYESNLTNCNAIAKS